jgi:hypothetical protein
MPLARMAYPRPEAKGPRSPQALPIIRSERPGQRAHQTMMSFVGHALGNPYRDRPVSRSSYGNPHAGSWCASESGSRKEQRRSWNRRVVSGPAVWGSDSLAVRAEAWKMTTQMAGRVAIVTGVSRRAGIGFAVARDLLQSGMTVLIHSWTDHDAEQRSGRDAVGMPGVIEALRQFGGRLEHIEADLALPETPVAVVDTAVQHFGYVDVIVANHATSSGTQTLRVHHRIIRAV